MCWSLWASAWRIFCSDRELHRHFAVIYENPIALADLSVALSIDRQFAGSNAHVRITARHEAVGGLAVHVGQAFRRRYGPSVTIGYANGVAAYLTFYFA